MKFAISFSCIVYVLYLFCFSCHNSVAIMSNTEYNIEVVYLQY